MERAPELGELLSDMLVAADPHPQVWSPELIVVVGRCGWREDGDVLSRVPQLHVKLTGADDLGVVRDVSRGAPQAPVADIREACARAGIVRGGRLDGRLWREVSPEEWHLVGSLLIMILVIISARMDRWQPSVR